MEPVPVDAARLFDFIGASRLAVVLVSVHRLHTFNGPLGRQLSAEHEDIALGTVDLRDVIADAPALRFLHQGLLACGAPSAVGVVPGYFLFRGGEMLAWDPGLPAFDDVSAIFHSAILGALWTGLTRDVGFFRQALQLATEQVAAQRMAATFRGAIAGEGPRRAAREAPGAPHVDDLYWAYQTLGVLPTATDREVHEAWRKRRMEVHPDQATADPEEFARRSRLSAEINRARDVIERHRAGRSSAAGARAS